MTELTISLKTLTPLWTGGVDQSCDRLHETGLIGSLRWWYEALVRGLGGYACDPTSDSGCSFDSKAYEKAKKAAAPSTIAVREGTRALCAVCYLFGCTGWARLFRLRTAEAPMTNLHFCTTLAMNKSWLERVFAGNAEGIGSARVPYGDVKVEFSTRGQDEDYTRGQFALVLRLAAEYGGLGARLQHGFGQVSLGLPPELQVHLPDGIRQLTETFQELRRSETGIDTPFNLQNFVGMTYRVSASALSEFANTKFVAGKSPMSANYLPCVFDLRYKGSGKWGMRKWLKEQGWGESNDPGTLEDLDLLLGPRSQWGPKKKETKIDESLRTGSRIFFGMPYREKVGDGNYTLRIWAFWHHDLKPRLPNPETLRGLCQDYVQYVFDKATEVQSVTSGREILSKLGAK
jgi:CRISPR-associated protein Cmr1